jgi:hypothetical protein
VLGVSERSYAPKTRFRPGEFFKCVVSVAHAQEREYRQVSACGLAPDHEAVCTELRLRVFEEPCGDRLAVVGPRRERVLGSEAVIGAHHRHAGVIRKIFEKRVVLGGRAQGPPSAVDVNEYRLRIVFRREENAYGHGPGGSRDRDLGRARRTDDRSPEAAALLPGCSRLGGRDLVNGFHRRKKLLERLVRCSSLFQSTRRHVYEPCHAGNVTDVRVASICSGRLGRSGPEAPALS